MPSNIKIKAISIGCVKDDEKAIKNPYVVTKGFSKGIAWGWNENKSEDPKDTIYVMVRENVINEINDYLENGNIIELDANNKFFGIKDFIEQDFLSYKKIREQKIPKELFEDQKDGYTNRAEISYIKTIKENTTVNLRIFLTWRKGWELMNVDSGDIISESSHPNQILVLNPKASNKPGEKITPSGAEKAGEAIDKVKEGDFSGAASSLIDALPGLNDEQKQKLKTFIITNPIVSTVVAAVGVKTALGFLSSILGGGKAISFFDGDTLKTAALVGAAGLVYKQYQDNKAAGKPTDVFTVGANLFGLDTDDYMVYDGGAKKEEQIAQFQRCLVRLGKGNLEAERKNLQDPIYTPIIGVKVPGKLNYADDGRFGKWTLNASTNLFGTINTMNADEIKKDPSLEIKDPARVPLRIVATTACKGKTDANPSPQEKQEAASIVAATEAAKKTKLKKESKVYTEFPFLSTKNSRLHSTLMEQLKKDLKRG